MKLYDTVIEQILALVDASHPERKALPETEWRQTSDHSMILRGDMAYELGADLKPGFGATILTADASLVETDEILVCGKDLGEINENLPYARIALVRVRPEEMGEGNALYNAIRKFELVRYHFYPEGFMMRVSASKKKESIRVARDAVEKGISFSAVGDVMIRLLRGQTVVEAVKLIYITDPAFDYKELERLVADAEKITETIDHMLKDVKMDCDVCNLKQVCDEVEGLRELHFAQ